MKIKELNIGNWVLINSEPARALRLTQVGHSTFKGVSGQMYRVIGSSISPLPITPEILEKNGFVKESDVGYERFEWRENGSVAITLNRDSFSKSETFVLTTFKIGINGWLLKIEHVHQLQHAIRLAGIEKEIEV